MVLPISAVNTPSDFVLNLAGGSCAAASILLAAYPFAILNHYRIAIGANRTGYRAKGEPVERGIVVTAFLLAATVLVIVLFGD